MTRHTGSGGAWYLGFSNFTGFPIETWFEAYQQRILADCKSHTGVTIPPGIFVPAINEGVGLVVHAELKRTSRWQTHLEGSMWGTQVRTTW